MKRSREGDFNNSLPPENKQMIIDYHRNLCKKIDEQLQNSIPKDDQDSAKLQLRLRHEESLKQKQESNTEERNLEISGAENTKSESSRKLGQQLNTFDHENAGGPPTVLVKPHRKKKPKKLEPMTQPDEKEPALDTLATQE